MSTATARIRAILEHIEAHPELDDSVSGIHVAFAARVQLFVRDGGSYFATLVTWARTLTDTSVRFVYSSGYQLILSGVMDGGMRLGEVVAVMNQDEGPLILREVGAALRGTIELDTLARLADELAAARAAAVTA